MTRFSSAQVLAQLKDFQRRTVDHVFHRMYLDGAPTRRFLVADEVGLGKTMVAKGVIARTIEHLQDRVERINIVYVCSNSAIAKQNVSRLKVDGGSEFVLASRLTLLPTKVQDLREKRVNFVSFTPGTTFDLKSRAGLMAERAVLFRMLRGEKWLDEGGLLNVLQATAGRTNWEAFAVNDSDQLDAALTEAFRRSLRGDKVFRKKLIDLCLRCRDDIPPAQGELCYAVIGELRQRLARVCLAALEPDLIILDEFQRFRNLLNKDDPTAELAQMLFNHGGARVLMLSATPYKMLSLDHEDEDDHYPDFLKTLGFLFNQPGAVEATEEEIRSFRHALLELDLAHPGKLGDARRALEQRLRSVMCRTERVGFTARQDAMVGEPSCSAPLHPADLQHAALLSQVSEALGGRDAIEYWKSAPYALNFMKNYELRRKLEQLEGEPLSVLARLVHARKNQLLQKSAFQDYTPVDPANARLRNLFADTLDRGLWKVLWLPPSLPSWLPSGAFADIRDATKALVFSAWNVVPDAIAALCSYEAERRMLEGLGRDDISHNTLYDRVKPLLRLSGAKSGMPTLLLMYPSPSLASLVDPVGLALELGKGETPRLEVMLEHLAKRIRARLAPLVQGAAAQGREDERWYWAAVALLDAATFPNSLAWCESGWRAAEQGGEADTGNETESGMAFGEHLERFVCVPRGGLEPALGRPPRDLPRVLAELALAGPGVCALRALRRVAAKLAWDDPALLAAAANVAEGFRTLFNVPESIALLRGSEDAAASYWRTTLKHGLEGNLPALLDEQVHVLRESLGQVDKDDASRVTTIGAEIAASLSIRTAQLSVDELCPRPILGRIDYAAFKLRCRFALRFGDMKDEKSEARVETVRSAFNSPFRPFVLASTSVGQEGLDFHHWCHAIVHWNLPSNPVDLEQREGRVHRFKGHAVRRNVARELGLPALLEGWKNGDDPWQSLFTTARKSRSGDLLTYWLFEVDGGAQIERRVPLLPMSREAAQLMRLKRGLALYRLVFGQPRQEDLLTHLAEHLAPEDIARVVAEWRIDLTPPPHIPLVKERILQAGLVPLT